MANGQYTFYVWLKVASGTMTVSLGILDNGWTTWLAGPTAVTLTTSWQRFKVTATMTGGATGALGGDRPLHGRLDGGPRVPCVGRVPPAGQRSEARHTPGRGATRLRRCSREWRAGQPSSPRVNSTDSPFKVRGPGSNLADHTLLEVTAGGELIIAGSTGNGYRLAELMGATNPSGWSGVLKVKNPAGVTAGYILLYSNP